MRETKNHLVDAAANLNLKKNNSLNSKGRREFYSPGKSTTACDCYIYISGARGSSKSIEANCQGLSCPRIRENTGCSALHTSDLGLHLQNPLVPVSSCSATCASMSLPPSESTARRFTHAAITHSKFMSYALLLLRTYQKNGEKKFPEHSGNTGHLSKFFGF